MQPQRPRQHLYADLIPMFKGKYSYILFALDAYSQYIYAIPLKSKTSDDVLQGFLSIFGTTGWYENIYLDNETSFIKTSKLLVKIAPIKIHYSTPYCHFQNSAENYIKNFKRIFLKILNDQQNPQENADWPLLLPTVTQALNRQIIPQLGMSRETIHYNTTQNFHPLAEITSEANAPFDQTALIESENVFTEILLKRQKSQKYSRKSNVPHFTENTIVFMRDLAPSVSTILKIPQRGPYTIKKVEDRNVTLTEIETGKTVHSHVENIRPLSISEFRLLLTNKWDLNTHTLKANEPLTQPGIFYSADDPLTLAEAVQAMDKSADDEALVKKDLNDAKNTDPSIDATFAEAKIADSIEDEIDLERLFYEPPSVTTVLAQKDEITVPNAPNASNDELIDEFDSTADQPLDNLQFNSLHARLDLTKSFANTLKTKNERLVSFFLTKKDQYIKISDMDSEID